jgi:PAS domain S-box-containing protein
METARAITADPGGTSPPLPTRVRAPAALSEAELVWSVLKLAPDAVLLCDRDGEVLLVNGRAVDLLGRDEDDLVGLDLDDLVPGLEAAAPRMTGHPSESPVRLEARAPGGRPLSVEVRVGWISTDEETLLAAFVRRA